MDIEKSIDIISALANGVDPHSGEVFSADSPYQNSETTRALFVAIKALERVQKIGDRKKQLPNNAGKPWEEEEDQRLVSGFDSGKIFKELAETHQRTAGSIRSRLIKLGKVQI